MAKDDLVFIDIETTGLDWDQHHVIEIAWMTEDMEEPEILLPYPYPHWVFASASPEAMEINNFIERYGPHHAASSIDEVTNFVDVVTNSTLVGANVRFDARFIEKFIGFEPWHHRFLEMQSYIAGNLALPKPVGWGEVVERVIALGGDITEPDHTAFNDCLSVSDVYRWAQA